MIDVPPNLTFKAKIFQPKRLGAIYCQVKRSLLGRAIVIALSRSIPEKQKHKL